MRLTMFLVIVLKRHQGTFHRVADFYWELLFFFNCKNGEGLSFSIEPSVKYWRYSAI